MNLEEKDHSIFDRALSSLMKWKIKNNSFKKKKVHCIITYPKNYLLKKKKRNIKKTLYKKYDTNKIVFFEKTKLTFKESFNIINNLRDCITKKSFINGQIESSIDRFFWHFFLNIKFFFFIIKISPRMEVNKIFNSNRLF